jgi:hypothetical protein
MSKRQSRAHMAAWAKIWNLARGSSIEKTRRFWSSSRDLSLFHSHGYSINRQNHRYQNLDTSPGFPSSFSSSRFVLATTIKNLIYQDYFLFNWLIMKKISSTNSIHQRQNAKSFTYLHMYFFRLTQNSLRQIQHCWSLRLMQPESGTHCHDWDKFDERAPTKSTLGVKRSSSRSNQDYDKMSNVTQRAVLLDYIYGCQNGCVSMSPCVARKGAYVIFIILRRHNHLSSDLPWRNQSHTKHPH